VVSASDIIADTRSLIQAKPEEIKSKIEFMMTRPTIKSVRMQENLDSVFNRQRVEYKLLKSGKSLPVQQEVSKTNQESGLEED